MPPCARAKHLRVGKTPEMRDELRTTLRSAAYIGDGSEIVRALDRVDPRPFLQLAGDGVLAAVTQSVDGATRLARSFVEALSERGWEGDEELAVQLGAALDGVDPPGLAELTTSLDELSGLLDDGQGEGGAINLRDGTVWPMRAIDYSREIDETIDVDDPDEWLWVASGGSRSAYRDMEAFIGTVTDLAAAERLQIAIDGPGAFGRFRRELDRDDELQTRWHDFSEERRLGRARAALAHAGYRTAPIVGHGMPDP